MGPSPSSEPVAGRVSCSTALVLVLSLPGMLWVHRVHWDDAGELPHPRRRVLTTSSQSVLPCRVTCSQAPGIGTWASLGAIIQPSTVCPLAAKDLCKMHLLNPNISNSLSPSQHQHSVQNPILQISSSNSVWVRSWVLSILGQNSSLPVNLWNMKTSHLLL